MLVRGTCNSAETCVYTISQHYWNLVCFSVISKFTIAGKEVSAKKAEEKAGEGGGGRGGGRGGK